MGFSYETLPPAYEAQLVLLSLKTKKNIKWMGVTHGGAPACMHETLNPIVSSRQGLMQLTRLM